MSINDRDWYKEGTTAEYRKKKQQLQKANLQTKNNKALMAVCIIIIIVCAFVILHELNIL